MYSRIHFLPLEEVGTNSQHRVLTSQYTIHYTMNRQILSVPFFAMVV
jgi:hypothetical protein